MALKQVVLDGPDVEATGLSAWTLSELCREVEERWYAFWESIGAFKADPRLYAFTGDEPPGVDTLRRRYTVQATGRSADSPWSSSACAIERALASASA